MKEKYFIDIQIKSIWERSCRLQNYFTEYFFRILIL